MPFTEQQLTNRLGKPSARAANQPSLKGAHATFGNKVPTRLPDTLQWECGCVAKPGFSGKYDVAACDEH
ncbi:MAG: hypothetical protein NVSMB31_19900 [Vulcanimicrobiaceae bacterium]